MIRPATPRDVEAVVPLIIQAMDKLAQKLTHTNDKEVINKIFKHFFVQTGNQYSYENTLVFEDEGEIIGSINAYDGAKLLALRKPFLTYLAEHYQTNDNSKDVETESGEFYLDTISVNPLMQGKGIGKQLIKAGIAWAKQLGHYNIGLLVEQNNDRALKLYQNIGFAIQNEKQFMGGLYHHMVFKINC
ncbi:ribosomal protein S18 acetylase RimI-like enzyme [Pedobacter sp. AK013]|uniref:GNAT family N-acetyltransferase n=1 Tax=Pedobacter sp. AK013 TaxID=2723071 RepID=UPI00161BDB1C|nr:GNAT family N-acetyltransferase [Pedobacter sp. AK013]MBB6240230.1 ribosomal protein S18 acetylase RimI-like enzyme [Pedobacter sp. AK013]